MTDKTLTFEQCLKLMKEADNNEHLRISHTLGYSPEFITAYNAKLLKIYGVETQQTGWRLYVERPHYDLIDGRLIHSLEHKDITHIITDTMEESK